VLVLFFSSIALVPFGFIGGEFFAKSDGGEFLVQIELPKMLHWNKVILWPKAEAFLNTKICKSLITKVGQTSEGMGASQSTAYKSEIDVKMIDQKTEQMILLCRPNETAIEKNIGWCQSKTVGIILGTADAPIALILQEQA
jgi:HAE1 family hydrophobic/amphiphilic exporter-1